MRITWTTTKHNPGLTIEEIVGLVSLMLNDTDPRSATQQLHDGYTHGGGWQPLPGFTFIPEDQSIKYPGDPRMKPWAYAKLRDELILVYESGWFCIVQPDGSFEVARMD